MTTEPRRQRATTREILTALVLYVDMCEIQEKSTEAWIRKTNWSAKDLARWKQPTRPHLENARLIFKEKKTIEECEAESGKRGPKSNNKALTATNGKKTTKNKNDDDASAQLSVLGDSDDIAIALRDENTELKAEVRRLKALLSTQEDEVKTLVERRVRLHELLGRVTEVQINTQDERGNNV